MHIDCETLVRLSKASYFNWMVSLAEVRKPKKVLVAPDVYVAGELDCESVVQSEQFKKDLRRLKTLQGLKTITVEVGPVGYSI